jgi:glycosyltransferase involved in cell wall biosynthesis
MRIVHLSAGAGVMYCGACARDIVLGRGLQELGHDFEIVPLYTPLKVDGEGGSAGGEVFLGGINAWLQQHAGLFRALPPAWDRPLDNPALLQWAAHFAVRTDPKQLGAMTVSVLAGQEGRQRKEILRLLDHLQAQRAPDVFSLSNSLLSGLARPLQERFGVPVVCGLQGEEAFVASLPERYREQAQGWMRTHARHVDLFLAPGDAYGAAMASYLDVPDAQVATARAGLDLERFARPGPRPTVPFTIGYLSVIIPRKGLDVLAKAFIRLVEQGHDVRLRVAGRCLSPAYLRHVRQMIARAGLAERCEFLGELDPAAKVRFLHECSVFAVPSRFAESRGIAILEAAAAGVPVVMPDLGIYPELVRLLDAGALHAPEDDAALATALEDVRLDPAAAEQTVAMLRAGLEQHFSRAVTSRRVDGLLNGLVSARA